MVTSRFNRLPLLALLVLACATVLPSRSQSEGECLRMAVFTDFAGVEPARIILDRLFENAGICITKVKVHADIAAKDDRPGDP